MKNPILQALQKHLRKDELEELLELLTNDEKDIPDAFQKRSILLMARLEQLEEKLGEGTINNEAATIERNSIRASVADILEDFQAGRTESISEQVKKKNKRSWLIASIVYGFCAIALIWWLFQPQPGFRITAKLLVDGLSFTYLSGPTDFGQGDIQLCSWQNYETATFEAEQLLLDEDLDNRWDDSLSMTDILKLQTDPDIAGLALRFGPARLEKLFLEPETTVNLILPQGEQQLFRLSIQQEKPLQGRWVYRDSLRLEAEQVLVEGLEDYEDFLYPAAAKLLPPKGLAREFSIKSYPGNTDLELQFDKANTITSKNLTIRNPVFLRPVETVAVPTIRSGEIQIGKTDAPALRTIMLQEGERLDLTHTDPLTLEEMSIQESAIALKLQGKLTGIATGAQQELRTPYRVEWLWHAHRLLLLSLGIAFIGLSVFLPEGIRKRILDMFKLVKGF